MIEFILYTELNEVRYEALQGTHNFTNNPITTLKIYYNELGLYLTESSSSMILITDVSKSKIS